MTRLFYLLLFCLAVSLKVNAQQITIQGYLRDSITHYPITGVVTNMNTKKKVSTNSNGFFRIEASPNDFFYVLAPSYHYDTITYSYLFSDTISIYLSPSFNILANVTVRSQYSRYQVDSMNRRKEFIEDRGTQLKAISAANNSGFGIGINLDRFFKKKYKYKKTGDNFYEMLEQTAYVDYRFSPQLVAYYTGFKGDTLQSFIQKYSPGYTWLRKHPTNEDVLYYINDKLKEFSASNNSR